MDRTGTYSAQWQQAEAEVTRLKAEMPERIKELAAKPQAEVDSYIDGLHEEALATFLKPEGWPRHYLYMSLRYLRTPKPIEERIIRNAERLGLTMKPRRYAHAPRVHL